MLGTPGSEWVKGTITCECLQKTFTMKLPAEMFVPALLI